MGLRRVAPKAKAFEEPDDQEHFATLYSLLRERLVQRLSQDLAPA